MSGALATFWQLRVELLVLGAALLVIVVDLALPRGDRRWLGWFSGALGLLLALALVPEWARAGQGRCRCGAGRWWSTGWR